MKKSLTKQLAEICCAWNNGELEPKLAMAKIWDLFKKENLEEWRRRGKGGK